MTTPQAYSLAMEESFRHSKRGGWNILDRYLTTQFLRVFFVCLFIAVGLFMVVDFFERTRVVIKEDASFFHFASYLALKIPLVVHLMTPVAVLVASLFSVAKLCQLSEITAMRSCGLSVLRIVRPLVLCGIVITFLMFLLGETIVPWAAYRVEEIYNFDIRRKVEKGVLSREHYWYRAGDKFFNIGLYDSRHRVINNLSMFKMSSDFRPEERLDASSVRWENAQTGWVMSDVNETSFRHRDKFSSTSFRELPLVISETPQDLYKLQREPETMNYLELSRYIEKLKGEGVPSRKYEVDLQAKISFPFLCVILVMIAVPFALVSARSGALTVSFVAGISIGFGYYIAHALLLSLGSANLLPVLVAAWSANIIFLCLGLYFLLGTEN